MRFRQEDLFPQGTHWSSRLRTTLATISVSSCLIPNPGTSPAVLLNYAWRSCCQLGSSACSIIRWVEILHCCPARSIQALRNAAGCQASKRSSTCQVAFSPFSSINCWSYLLSGCGQFNGTRRSGLPPVDPVPNSNLSSGFYDFLLHMNLKINLTHMSTQQNWSCIWRHQQRKTADFIRRRRGEKEGVNKKLFVFPFTTDSLLVTDSFGQTDVGKYALKSFYISHIMMTM